MEPTEKKSRGPLPASLVVMVSYHHNNTKKIADAIAAVLRAEIVTPDQVTPGTIAAYDLVGFGSGIYGGTFDPSVLDLAGRLSDSTGRKAFLFSTYGAPAIIANREFVEKNHEEVRTRLRANGFTVIGEFGCPGWNTNSFLQYFGGLNKGKPDADDILNAEAFALKMLEKARGP